MKILKRIGIVILIMCLFGCIFIYGVFLIIYKSDNTKTKEILTLSLLETSAGYFIPSLFLSNEELNEIKKVNNFIINESIYDDSLIEVITSGDLTIELIEISGSKYKGRVLIINDPSRVYIATPSYGFNNKNGGMSVSEYIQRDDAIAGINGGGFIDKGGSGNGSTPEGYVIIDGELVYGKLSDSNSVVGFDSDNKLIVGTMRASEAIDVGIVNGLCFNLSGVGALLINGNKVVESSTSSLNPRTAIGQRSDGSIVLVNIDGRQVNSLGASYNDLIEIFLEYDVINAANLDGGSSAMMIYNNQVLTNSSSLVGVRSLPTAILVK